MCLAIPGQILEINEDEAILDYWVEKRKAKIVDGDYKIGDYVIAQGGFVVMKVTEKQAKDSLEAFKNSQL